MCKTWATLGGGGAQAWKMAPKWLIDCSTWNSVAWEERATAANRQLYFSIEYMTTWNPW